MAVRWRTVTSDVIMGKMYLINHRIFTVYLLLAIMYFNVKNNKNDI